MRVYAVVACPWSFVIGYSLLVASMIQTPKPNTGIQAWIRRNPGVTLSFVVIAAVSLSAFLYFFMTAR